MDGYSESSYSATPRFAAARLPWFFIDKTLPTVDVVILSLVVGASAQQLSRVLMSINRTFPYLACSQRI
ncbi:hypothetical protein ODR88_24445 [Escherichia coli]|nr:hypothetical protein [Escherichia coli]